MNESSHSNARVRSFFKFDPIEFSDDVVCALSSYISSAIDSLVSLMSKVDVSEKDKRTFISNLISVMQESLDKNADKFEAYILRNIFDISVNVDLAAAIDTPKKGESSNNSVHDSFGINDIDEEDLDENELDNELTQLYNKIQSEQNKRIELLASIKGNRVKLNEAKQIVERLPKINQIINLASQLPKNDIQDLENKIQNLLDTAKGILNKTVNEKKSIEFEKEAFQFD